jgi:crotonobetainyl-CoA:carnitine CoA-transferase CaiB-like acyl-CoA transferase
MLPLEDLRVLAIEQFGAGPWATLQLADLGADVIKVEDPDAGGDVGRYMPPYVVSESSLYFESFNRNKRSISLDLRHPSAREVLLDLVKRVDVVFSNLRGDLPAALGLMYEQLSLTNPRIVCCSLSGFGMSGPRASEGAYDHTIQGLSGWQSITGEPDSPPTKSGLSLVDFSAGYVAAISIIAAVWHSRREGKGRNVDLSLFETALAELAYIGTWVATKEYEPRRNPQSAHQTLVPFQNFETSDGWIVVACPKNSLWTKLCVAIGAEHLAMDERFRDFVGRDANRSELIHTLATIFKTDTTAAWTKRLANARVPCAPVNDIAGAFADEQVVARGTLVEFDHPTLGTTRTVASPFRMDAVKLTMRRGPFLGEHTNEVLRDLCGYSDDHIRNLASAGAFGSARNPA